VSTGISAASGHDPERTEVDKATMVTWARTAGVPALWAADAGKPAAVPDVMCSIKRGGMEMSNVTTAFAGLLIGSHRAGRQPDGKR
jgi:hypothetical protein